jgi:hypothetical protein
MLSYQNFARKSSYSRDVLLFSDVEWVRSRHLQRLVDGNISATRCVFRPHKREYDAHIIGLTDCDSGVVSRKISRVICRAMSTTASGMSDRVKVPRIDIGAKRCSFLMDILSTDWDSGLMRPQEERQRNA